MILSKKTFLNWILLIVIPFLLVRWLFWLQTDFSMRSDTKAIENPQTYSGDKAKVWKIGRNEDFGLKKIIRDIFQVPFDLTSYRLLLENKTWHRVDLEPEYIPVVIDFYSLKNTSLEDNVISLENAEFLFNLEIEKNGRPYTPPINSDYFMYGIRFKEDIFNEINTNTLVINVLPIDSKPLFKNQLVSSVIFILVWWGLYFLIIEVLFLLFPFLRKHK